MKKILGVILVLSIMIILSIVSVQAAVTNCTNSSGGNVTTNGAYFAYWDDVASEIKNVSTGNVCINKTLYNVAPTSLYFCGNVSVMVNQACTYDFFYTGFVGNFTANCSNLNATNGGPYTLGDGTVINTTINVTVYADRGNYIDLVSTPNYTSCTNGYTRNGPDGLCNGGGVLRNVTTVVAAGKVCVNGTNATANVTYNCAIWNYCIAGNTSYPSLYTGYDGIGSGCTATGWVVTGTTTTLASGVTILSYTNQTAACPTYNSALTSGCNNLKSLIFAAFGLLAVGIIVAAAFALIHFGDSAGLSIVAVSSIALAVVLFVGYIIMSLVAENVCVILPV